MENSVITRLKSKCRRPANVSNRKKKKTLSFEALERRNLLAAMWMNKGSDLLDSDGFEASFGLATAPVARAIAQRAVDNWNAVIQSFNYTEDSESNQNNDFDDVFSLRIEASELTVGGNTSRGRVQHASYDLLGVTEIA